MLHIGEDHVHAGLFASLSCSEVRFYPLRIGGKVWQKKGTFASLYGHFSQSHDIDVGQHFQELDLSKSCDWELLPVRLMQFQIEKLAKLTPSLSLCIRIFFKATMEPSVFTLAL